MTFSAPSFFAGVGTVFAALTVGVMGGAMMTSSPKSEPNRLERVAAQTPVAAREATVTQTPAPGPATTASAGSPETAPAVDRVIATAPAKVVEPPQPATVSAAVPATAAEQDRTTQIESARAMREAELKKDRADRQAELRRERRKRREIQAATFAVRQLRRDVIADQAPTRDGGFGSFGFFGND